MQRIQCRSENSKGVYCLQYDDEKIISGLRDNSIKVSPWMVFSLCVNGSSVLEGELFVSFMCSLVSSSSASLLRVCEECLLYPCKVLETQQTGYQYHWLQRNTCEIRVACMKEDCSTYCQLCLFVIPNGWLS